MQTEIAEQILSKYWGHCSRLLPVFTLRPTEEKCFKRIFHSYAQKHVSYKKNGINTLKILYTDLHKSFPIYYCLLGGFFKRILTYLYCTKCNEINVCHPYVQKYVSYEKTDKNSIYILYTDSNKSFLILMGKFKIYFNILILHYLQWN